MILNDYFQSLPLLTGKLRSDIENCCHYPMYYMTNNLPIDKFDVTRWLIFSHSYLCINIYRRACDCSYTISTVTSETNELARNLADGKNPRIIFLHFLIKF